MQKNRLLSARVAPGLALAVATALILLVSKRPENDRSELAPTPAPEAASSGWTIGPDPLKLPEGMPELGNQHGDVAISSNGDIYVSLMQGLRSGVQVYSADGTYLRNVKEAPTDFHGFVIHKGADGEFIYGPQLNAGKIVKLSLEGEVVMTIPGDAIPKEFWQVNPKNQQAALRLTGCTVAPNGDIFVTDGYASDRVHRLNAKGEYLASFGGKAAPYNFKTLHKIAIDTRFDPPRLVGTDRANNRAVHLSLEGELIGEIATDLLMPAAAVVQGDFLAVGEIKGRVTIFDKENRVVARLGANSNPQEVGTNKIEQAQWKPGVVNAPHGVAFSPAGDLFVSEYSVHGRVLKFAKAKAVAVR
ncbi:MAG: hypothetical protein QE273_05170, partial [Verrucomicrobiales bacterium]|nr:hypothetical protein [Verrucomicrobiales bacterium]